MWNDIGGGVYGAITNLVGTILGIITVSNLTEAVVFPFIGALAGLAATHLFKYLVKTIKKAWKK